MEGEQNREYTYNRKFEGNILIRGRTGCGKTTSIQELGKNKLFGDDITCFLGIKNFFNKRKRRFY